MPNPMLLLLLLTLSYCYGYEDNFPDPDFLPKSAENIPKAKEKLEDVCIEQSQKMPGYFKFILKEILKKNILSEQEEAMFGNAEFVDPQSLSEIILNLIPNVANGDQSSLNFTDFIAPSAFSKQEFVIVYIILMFVPCYFSQRCRSFILTLHGLLIYFAAVYSKINKQHAEIMGRKMAAITTMPNHCKEEFSVLSLISLAWSKFQIGDHCKRYQQEVISDPFYEIEYLKCLFYPIISVFSVPLAVLGEELGPFLENILTPFPFHLQIFILIFVATVMGALVAALCKLQPYTPSLPPVATKDEDTTPALRGAERSGAEQEDTIPALALQQLFEEMKSMRQEVRALQMTRYTAEVTDIVVLNKHDAVADEIDGNLTIDESRSFDS